MALFKNNFTRVMDHTDGKQKNVKVLVLCSREGCQQFNVSRVRMY